MRSPVEFQSLESSLKHSAYAGYIICNLLTLIRKYMYAIAIYETRLIVAREKPLAIDYFPSALRSVGTFLLCQTFY